MKRITLVLIALVASVALAACGDDASTSGGPSSASTSDHNAADVTFAQQMIPHHRQAIEMAEMASDRASTAEVKALATRIEPAQAPEITRMTEWLTSWDEQVPSSEEHGGMDGHGSMPSGGMMSDDEMAKLMDTTGLAFDRMFLTMMTKHHEGAIETARTEQAEGSFPPAKDLASKIIKDQQAEIDEMAELLSNL